MHENLTDAYTQQRRRSACTSAEYGQHLYYSLSGKYQSTTKPSSMQKFQANLYPV